MPDFLRAKPLKLLVLLVLLTGCEPSELYPAPALPIGGGNSGGNVAPAQRPIAPAMQDPEQEAERMGGSQQTEPVVAGTQKNAEKQCKKLAKGRTLKEVRWFQGNNWDCVFY